MTTLLLLVIYIGYIGLGLPDSLFGTSWPAIYPEMNLPVSYANFVTIINCMGTITSSVLSARIIKKLGTGGTTAVSTALTAISLLGISLSGNFLWICLFSIPLGLGAGAIDTALNNYVALHYSALHINFLHCFYGIGITVSPYLMSLALKNNNEWRNGYEFAFYIQIGITLITILSLPLWKRVKSAESADTQTESDDIIVLSYRKMLRNPDIVVTLFAFMASCSLEALCNIWGATYLVNAKSCNAGVAAKLIMLYYIGFTLGRFFSGILSGKLSTWTITKLSIGICFIGVVIVFLPLSGIVSAIGLCLIGLGVGPIFPNLTHLTPQIFGKQVSQSVIGAEMAASYVAYMLIPFLFGQAARSISISLYPFFLAAMFVLVSVCFYKMTQIKESI